MLSQNELLILSIAAIEVDIRQLFISVLNITAIFELSILPRA